jgi:phage shock protein PspC (stress-responsive transcriptional regulator)/predicted membrane protein
MMETEQTTSMAPGSASGPASQALIRPSTGRVLAGVAAAIANRFSLPVWLVRAIFVILTLSGGLGVVLYAAGWVLIPGDGDAKAAAGRFLDRIEGPRAWVGVGLMALAAIIVADSTRLLEADLVAAGLLILIGVLLYRGDIGSAGSIRESARNEEESTTMTYVPSGGPTTDTIDLSGPAQPPSPPPTPPPVPAAPLPTAPPPPPRERSILGRLTVAVGLITLGVMAFVDNVGATEVEFRHYTGAAMTVIGIGLLVGSVFGRARGLIVLGVILTPVLLTSPIAELDFGDTDVRYDVATVADIAPEYRLDVGQMVIDLTAVDFSGEEVTLDAEVGLGELVIVVPDDVAVEAYGEVAIGEVRVLGGTSGGLGEISLRRSAEGDNGTLTIDARVDIGRVEIGRAATLGLADLGSGSFVITTSAELEDGYDLGVGDYVFDLNALALEIDRSVSIELGTGTLTVILPADVASEVEASVGVGDLTLPDGTRSGLAPNGFYENGPDPRLSLDIEVGAGELTVVEEAMR